MTPRAASSVSILSALTVSSESRYRSTLVSKNESAPLIRFESIELERCRQPAPELAKSRQKFARAGCLGYCERVLGSNLNFDLIALFQSEGIYYCRGKSNCQAVTPS